MRDTETRGANTKLSYTTPALYHTPPFDKTHTFINRKYVLGHSLSSNRRASTCTICRSLRITQNQNCSQTTTTHALTPSIQRHLELELLAFAESHQRKLNSRTLPVQQPVGVYMDNLPVIEQHTSPLE